MGKWRSTMSDYCLRVLLSMLPGLFLPPTMATSTYWLLWIITTCSEKEAVLRRDHNQVINLTASIPTYNTLAGCFYINEKTIDRNNKVNQRSRKSSGKTFTITLPTLPQRYNIRTTSKIKTKSTIQFQGLYTTTEENLDETGLSSDYSKLSSTEGWTTKTQFDNLSSEGFSNHYKFINTTKETVKYTYN
ncbi:hypothetical protein WA026_012678 [Henosepilachna vigintioctopunctata]|uniref:Uncharacterized protein n=1 Tax=Henosepilachna vigintioctopunctata TaxID=420089 RepID=A0AAW1U6S7_9CUCU